MPHPLNIAETIAAEAPAATYSALDAVRAGLDAAQASQLDACLRSAREIDRAARTAREVASAAATAPLATAVPALDELLAGGLPRGQLVEMIGARSSGRFSAVLAAVAAATRAGEAAALVDLGDGLDPQAAADLGADLSRLLWLRPTNLKQALAGTEILIGGGFQMVALDLGSPPVGGGRGLEAGWLRLARAAQANGTALLVATPYRMSGTAAAVVLQAARGRPLWQGRSALSGGCRLLGGLSCQVAVEKHRGRPASPARRSRQMALRLPENLQTSPCPAIASQPELRSPASPEPADRAPGTSPRGLSPARLHRRLAVSAGGTAAQ
jgi:recA bacterial DNA recombination protein